MVARPRWGGVGREGGGWEEGGNLGRGGMDMMKAGSVRIIYLELKGSVPPVLFRHKPTYPSLSFSNEEAEDETWHKDGYVGGGRIAKRS